MNRLTTIVSIALLLPGCSSRTVPVVDGTDDTGATSTSGNPTTGPASTTGAPNPTATSAGDDETEDGGGDITTTGFVPDGGGMSCGEECDIWNWDDCPEGQKCTAVACEVGGSAWDSNVCRDIQGDAQHGDDCMYTDGSGVSGNDTCAEGLMCWNADADTGLGTCIAFCTGSPDAPMCPLGYNCHIPGNGTLPLCFEACDPLADDCPSNDVCVPTGVSYDCVLDASGDMAPYGTPCNYINVCNPGLACVDAAGVPEPSCENSAGCCSPFCNVFEPSICPGEGQTCEPVYDPQPPGFEHVGVCTIAF